MKISLEICRQKDEDSPHGFDYLIIVDGKKYAADNREGIGQVIVDELDK